MGTTNPDLPSPDQVMAPAIYAPPEIWSNALRSFSDCKAQDDLTYLWTTLRLVNRWFRIEVEEIFKKQHLEKTISHFDCGRLRP